ncbi:Glycoside hydrolase superfamily [Penicillium macrosclerotiorum]|uniref:Glycoside hydrolase superfamily n=1 Tax=Penicillium macrosclerotiorum TaxID=303699 RepID=UPI002547E224|nr:Glycoside hydrolase superfamily [Penicillium macrosclerotiorum]KAJ5689603.1 Glycoside hydrolase superfamily [Penicillium macrosclerotiorum]
MAESPYPSTLNGVFDAPLKERYDPVRLTSDNILPILELPLAKIVLGHDASDNESIAKVATGDISYTTFIANQAQAVLRASHADLTQEQVKSQLLHVGLAALFSFLQSNVTGPPLEFNSADTVIPSSLRSDVVTLRTVRAKIIRDLSVDGEAAYKLTPNPELFSVAKALLVDKSSDGSVLAKTARMRVNFLHQKMLSEVASTLQDVIYKDVEQLAKAGLDADETGRFMLERAIIHTHHGFDGKARADLDQASQVRKFEFALTGKMGKRTKFQERDTSQLVVLAKSADEGTKSTESSGPKKLDLNDDTLLEAISFADKKSSTVQDDLSEVLQSVDPNDQPILNPVDSAILLAMASAITNTAPENGLTREETQPYATRVLEGGSSNWQIYTEALLVRSRVEGYRSRTVERAVLQMQALVDQVLADTATDDSAAQQPSSEPTTFLPRPEKSESAPAADRLEYIWLLNFSTRWHLEAELAKRWIELGGLRTALEIYERLHMWAEAALCYAATEREAKAKAIVRRQLYEAKGEDEDDENELFEGPERSVLPADAPRLFCILGDIDKDETMYERAWDVSEQRYARAQRSLARHYLALTPPELEKAEAAYKQSLHINRLNNSSWFALGCVQLELQKWHDATDSFTRAVQLDDTDGEAWSNLAAAMLRTPAPEPTPEVVIDESTGEQSTIEADPHKRKREALAALQRAAQLKGTDARIWDNVLTVAASIPPPSTPFRDVIMAQKRVIELIGAKKGEKCIDLPILGMLIDFLITAFEYDSLLIQSDDGLVVRTGTIPGQILSLVDNNVVPLITHSSTLWLLVSRVEMFRNRPSRALEAQEKAWRATVAASAQGAFQMGDEKPWLEVVRSTEKLVREGYARYGPMDREDQKLEGDAEAEPVARDWRFKARSAVRGIMGKGKEFWEDSEGWTRLTELQSEVTGN